MKYLSILLLLLCGACTKPTNQAKVIFSTIGEIKDVSWSDNNGNTSPLKAVPNPWSVTVMMDHGKHFSLNVDKSDTTSHTTIHLQVSADGKVIQQLDSDHGTALTGFIP